MASQFDWNTNPEYATNSIYYRGKLQNSSTVDELVNRLEGTVSELLHLGYLELSEDDWSKLKKKIVKKWKEEKSITGSVKEASDWDEELLKTRSAEGVTPAIYNKQRGDLIIAKPGQVHQDLAENVYKKALPIDGYVKGFIIEGYGDRFFTIPQAESLLLRKHFGDKLGMEKNAVSLYDYLLMKFAGSWDDLDSSAETYNRYMSDQRNQEKLLAAFKDPETKTIYTDTNHFNAYRKSPNANPDNYVHERERMDDNFGFVHNGRFISRQEAERLLGAGKSSLLGLPQYRANVKTAEYTDTLSPEEQEFIDKVNADPQIQFAEKENEKAGDVRYTLGGMNKETGEYSPEGLKIQEEVMNSFLEEGEKLGAKVTSGAPRVVMTIGKPGAGKTTMLDTLADISPTVVVNPDEIMTKLPGWKAELGTAFHEWAADISKKLLVKAMNGKYNILLDSSGKNKTKMLKVVDDLTKNGYKIDCLYADVDSLTSAKRCYAAIKLGRYVEKHERYMPVELALRDYRTGPAETYKALIESGKLDTWRHYDRTEGVKLLDSGSREETGRQLGDDAGGDTGVVNKPSEDAKDDSTVHVGPEQKDESKGTGEGPESEYDSKYQGLEGYLKKITKMFNDKPKEGNKYAGYDHFILDKGKLYKNVDVKTLPKDVPQGKLGNCFMDAFNLMMDSNEKYKYVEGYVTVHGVPIMHAWNEDANGNVVDRTLGGKNALGRDRNSEYYGVLMSKDEVLKTVLSRGKYGTIENWEQDNPVIRLGKIYDPDWKKPKRKKSEPAKPAKDVEKKETEKAKEPVQKKEKQELQWQRSPRGKQRRKTPGGNWEYKKGSIEDAYELLEV
jgi:hypothetical protein